MRDEGGCQLDRPRSFSLAPYSLAWHRSRPSPRQATRCSSSHARLASTTGPLCPPSRTGPGTPIPCRASTGGRGRPTSGEALARSVMQRASDPTRTPWASRWSTRMLSRCLSRSLSAAARPRFERESSTRPGVADDTRVALCSYGANFGAEQLRETRRRPRIKALLHKRVRRLQRRAWQRHREALVQELEESHGRCGALPFVGASPDDLQVDAPGLGGRRLSG